MNIRSKVGATALATACLLGLALASYAAKKKPPRPNLPWPTLKGPRRTLLV